MENVQHICIVSWFPMYAAHPTRFIVFELIIDLLEPLYQNLFIFFASGVGLSPLYCGHFLPIVPAPDDR
jgi:hypothetical protein